MNENTEQVWAAMNPEQRNHLIGEMIKAKPLTQCFFAVDGRRVGITPYEEEKRADAEALLKHFTSNDDHWADFKKKISGAEDSWRGKITVDVERHHLRYYDTPGGAWCVVEWLIEQGFNVTLDCDDTAITAAAAPIADLGAPYKSTGATLGDAVCDLVLRLKEAA